MAKFAILTATCAAAFCVATAASAATVTYYLGNTASYSPSCGDVDAGPNPDEAYCSVNGLDLKITGYAYNTVTGEIDTSRKLDLDQGHTLSIGSSIDNFGRDEALVLSFGKTVTLSSLGFGYVDRNDEVSIGVLANLNARPDPFYTYDIPGYYWSSLALPGPNLTELIGDTFVVGTTTDCYYYEYCDNDNWTLKYVTVEHDDQLPEPPDSTSPVPLPAAGWMLMFGLAGLGAVARRSKRKNI